LFRAARDAANNDRLHYRAPQITLPSESDSLASPASTWKAEVVHIYTTGRWASFDDRQASIRGGANLAQSRVSEKDKTVSDNQNALRLFCRAMIRLYLEDTSTNNSEDAKRLGIYRRSTEKQELPIEDQRKEVHTYAQQCKLQVVREFKPHLGYGSGLATDRDPTFLEMIRVTEQEPHGAKYLLVYDVSRFGRVPPDPAGNSVRVTNRASDWKSNKMHRVVWTPSPTEAPAVRWIFETYQKGTGLNRIVQQMNSQRIPAPRGRHWSKTLVHYLLKNR
jgi:hypothetical protein